MVQHLIVLALSLCLGVSEPASDNRPEAPAKAEPEATVTAASSMRPLRIALNEDLPTLDPHRHLSIVGFAVLGNIFEPLICRDKESEVVPCLAARWTHEDFRRWTFFLHGGVRFHHGATMSVDDVVFSLERARSPTSLVSSFLTSLDRIDADPEAGTVTLELARPDPFFLESLSHIVIVPKDSPADITIPSGTGPYRFVDYQAGKRIRLQRFEGWRDPLPSEPEVEMLIEPDPEKAVALLERGTVDLVVGLPPTLVRRVESDPALWVESRLGNGILYLNLNPGFGPWEDPRIRRAVDLGIDRPALVRDISLNHSRVASQMLHPGILGYEPKLDAPERDVAEARRLVAQTGLETPVPLEIQTTDSSRSFAESVASQLAEVGFDVKVVVRPWPELYPDFAAGKVGAWLGMWIFDSNDGALYFSTMAHRRTADGRWGSSDAIAPEVQRDKDFEQDIRATFNEIDLETRRSLIQSLSRRSTSMRLQVPLLWPLDLYGTRRELQWQARKDSALRVDKMRRATTDKSDAQP